MWIMSDVRSFAGTEDTTMAGRSRKDRIISWQSTIGFWISHERTASNHPSSRTGKGHKLLYRLQEASCINHLFNGFQGR